MGVQRTAGVRASALSIDDNIAHEINATPPLPVRPEDSFDSSGAFEWKSIVISDEYSTKPQVGH